MTQDEIIEMAIKVDLNGHELAYSDWFKNRLKAFAKLVADKRVEGMVVMTPDEFKSVWDKAQAEEREACAKVCEDSVEYAGDTLADAIRARNKR